MTKSSLACLVVAPARSCVPTVIPSNSSYRRVECVKSPSVNRLIESGSPLSSRREPTKYVDLVPGDALLVHGTLYLVVGLDEERVFWLDADTSKTIDTRRSEDFVYVHPERLLVAI